MTREEVAQKQGIEEQIFRTIHDDRPELFLACPVPFDPANENEERGD